MAAWKYTKGLHEVGNHCYAYLQPDGSWGWSNAGLIQGDGDSLLVDTLFDLRLTADMLAAMTADELFLGYLKPVVEKIGDRIAEYADGHDVHTKALPLPPKGHASIGWRCFQGRVPVNVYVLRRMEPDRHQFIVDTVVQKESEDGN